MWNHSLGCSWQGSFQSFITVHGTSLAVETFAYLGSTLISDGFLDDEIHLFIQKASVACGMREKWVWTNSNFTHKTKVNV